MDTSVSSAGKLPVLKILLTALYYLFHFRVALLKGLLIPVSLSFVALFLNGYFAHMLSGLVFILIVLSATLVAFSLIAVTCHRIFLNRVFEGSSGWVVFRLGDLRFILRLVGLGTICLIVTFPILFPLVFTQLPYLVLLAAIPACYLFARMSPSLPAAAVGDPSPMADAWEWSQGNGWRLVILVVLLPISTHWLIGWAVPAGAPQFMPYLAMPISLAIIVFEVAVMSLAYGALREQAEAEPGSQ